MRKHDWEQLTEDLEPFAPIESEYEIARILGLHRGTVRNALLRGDLPMSLIGEPDAPPDSGFEKVSYRERGNMATLKYKSGEPLTPEEALRLAEIDTDEWQVTDQEVNMWQVARKDREADLVWEDGIMTGHVKDTGKMAKEYLYGVSLKLTRIRRVAVKPVLRPMNFSVISDSKPTDFEKRGLTALFIADPHFGFRRMPTGMTPIHCRPFINGLLTIADTVQPNVVVWNGDVLDLAEIGRFDTEPELLNSTQMAGVELGWVLSQFRSMSKRQVILEGNHEIRLQKALVKNLSAGYQLKPIHDLGGYPLLSVPRFLGLDTLDTEWIGDYPSGTLKIGTARFQHGNVVRKGSAKTISSMLPDLTGDRFFGHIHRYELAQKYIVDEGRSIWAGSPGCACDKRHTPGSDDTHNWQLGAFLIHFSKESGAVQNVEHISANGPEDPIWFRGLKFASKSYMPEFRKSLPVEYDDWFSASF